MRVLLDAVGVRYSHPPITRWLRRHRVPTALFLPTWVPAMWPFLNLRNHRKILVVDGRVAFTGGMNIREQFARDAKDLHFRLTGPVVEQLMRCFADDWGFATGERLSGPPGSLQRPKPGVSSPAGSQAAPMKISARCGMYFWRQLPALSTHYAS